MLEIFIGDTKIIYFSEFTYGENIDKVGDSIQFTAPFNSDSLQERELFRPYSYKTLEVLEKGTRIFTGRVEAITPDSDSSQGTVVVQGRSLNAIIVDVTFEQADFPVNFISQDLEQISNQLLSKYSVGVVFEDDKGAIFQQAGPEAPTEKVFDFLQNLARQRGLLMGRDSDGNLVYRKAKTDGPVVAQLVQGKQGVTVSAPSYDGTKRFSVYEAFGQEAGKPDNIARYTDESIPILRPKAVQTNDTNSANIVDPAQWAAATDFANSLQYPVALTGWYKPGTTDVWRINEIVTLQAPDLMVYSPFEFLIISVKLDEDNTVRTAELVLVLLGAYSGELPTRFPWDD